MPESKIRKPYGPRKRVLSKPEGETMTKQSHKRECDINYIVPKAQRDGILEHVNTMKAVYGDFSSVGDYQAHMEQLIAAEDAFMQLPSEIRTKCGNSQIGFMQYMEDPANLEEQIKFGLVEKPAPPPPKAPEAEEPAEAEPADT